MTPWVTSPCTQQFRAQGHRYSALESIGEKTVARRRKMCVSIFVLHLFCFGNWETGGSGHSCRQRFPSLKGSWDVSALDWKGRSGCRSCCLTDETGRMKPGRRRAVRSGTAGAREGSAPQQQVHRRKKGEEMAFGGGREAWLVGLARAPPHILNERISQLSSPQNAHETRL